MQDCHFHGLIIIQHTTVIANGTSCRQEIDDLAGRKAVHLAVALAEFIED